MSERDHEMIRTNATSFTLPDAPALLSGPDGLIVRLTHQAEQLFGEEAARALIGQPLEQVIGPEKAPARLRSREGGVRLIRDISWSHETEQSYLVTILVDVSDLTSVNGEGHEEAQLVEAQRVTRVNTYAQRVARIGVWEWEEGTELIRLSEVLQELTDTPPGVRLSFREYLASVHPDDQNFLRTALSPLIERDQPVESEHRYIRKDGSVRIFRMYGTTAYDSDGKRLLVGTAQDITEERTPERDSHRSDYDAVTGLPGRTTTKALLEDLSQRPNGKLAVLSCGVDNFNRIVTSLGHDAAEELLIVLGQRLQHGLPPGCTAARIFTVGGFMIVCSDVAALGGAQALIRRIRGLLRPPVPIHGESVQVTVAIGVAEYNAEDDVENLLRYADVAMFAARDRGPGQVAHNGPELMRPVNQQMRLEGELREALYQNELTLHYQPIVHADGSFYGGEALIRWNHPDRGLLLPGDFLPIAQRGGLLRAIDQWVLRTALQEGVNWQSAGEPLSIGLNLTGLVPTDPEFDAIVTEAVNDSGVSWNRVVLELVEAHLADGREGISRSMNELVNKGLRFAIDDFGTGYSSLSRLASLPADIIKIDRRFIRSIDENETDQAVARAMVQIAHALGRHCTAEGVETAAQLRVLAELGVNTYQGWLFSKATPNAEFEQLIAGSPIRIPDA